MSANGLCFGCGLYRSVHPPFGINMRHRWKMVKPLPISKARCPSLKPSFIKSIHTSRFAGKMQAIHLDSGFKPVAFDEKLFHSTADTALETLFYRCEEIEDSGIQDFDVFLKDGILEMDFGNKETFVINKQSFNKQIWWSSPISGPKRFNYDAESGSWRDARNGDHLFEIFNREVSEMLQMRHHDAVAAKFASTQNK